MEKIPLKYPPLRGCTQYHEKEYKKGCTCCKLLNKEIRAAFIEKTRAEAYKIINSLWPEYLEFTQKRITNENAEKKIIIKNAMRLITEAKCPWNNKLGIRLWNNVLINLARLKEDYYIPTIRVKVRNEETKKTKTETHFLW